MPQSQITVASEQWSAAIGPIASGAKVRIQNIGGYAAIVQAFPNGNAPGAGADAGGVYLFAREGWTFEFANDFPGVASPTHYRVYAPAGTTSLSVSHA